jgi:predicted Zn-dependent protease
VQNATGQVKEAIQFLSNVVRLRPKNVAGWEALIRCLYAVEYYEEALEQIQAAMRRTDSKPIFYYYLSATILRWGNQKKAFCNWKKP